MMIIPSPETILVVNKSKMKESLRDCVYSADHFVHYGAKSGPDRRNKTSRRREAIAGEPPDDDGNHDDDDDHDQR
jgi:hypothetical protein